MTATVHHGSNLDILPTLPDASIDAIVTDPPYELGFMGKEWDASGIAYSVELWRECLRVLKPGGHLLAFGGTRTYHRMAVAIEDAGFEIRDSIHWLYGSGFPKSLDVSKAIDKQRDDRDDIYKVTAWVREARDAAGITNRDIDVAFGFAGMAGHWTSAKSQPSVPKLDQVPTLLDALGIDAEKVPEDIRRLLWDLNSRKGQPGENWAKREVIGTKVIGTNTKARSTSGASALLTVGGETVSQTRDITAPATDAAKQWEGWGTALKPAHEPIVVARKPLDGTVAANILQHGTGALNIDGCRVEVDRWPANVVVDDHIAEQHPDWAHYFYCAKPARTERSNGLDGLPVKRKSQLGSDYESREGLDDVSARFVSAQPVANHHPTVKPVELMRWLVRLVTPPNGTILDPFAGSGTTLVAAILENLNCVGIELTADYLPIIEGRIAKAATAPVQERLL